jgi:hypothetical protein
VPLGAPHTVPKAANDLTTRRTIESWIAGTASDLMAWNT